jgi:hypothetical protein
MPSLLNNILMKHVLNLKNYGLDESSAPYDIHIVIQPYLSL